MGVGVGRQKEKGIVMDACLSSDPYQEHISDPSPTVRHITQKRGDT